MEKRVGGLAGLYGELRKGPELGAEGREGITWRSQFAFQTAACSKVLWSGSVTRRTET